MSDQPEQSSNPFAIFSDRVREPIEGLAHIGHLEKEISFCGHTFVLKTLRPAEKAAIAVAVKEWRDTLAEAETWANAHVGLALVSIDGSDAFCPPAGPDLNSFARARLSYTTNPKNGWHKPTLDFLFNTLVEMESRAYEAVKEFRDLAERSQQPLQPSADSLTEPGISTNETAGVDPT